MERVFQAGKYSLPLGKHTYIMGILNVTPDSFSDGGQYLDPQKAAQRALEMQEQGADILDMGGQSTRPGYTALSWEEEWERIAPVFPLLQGKLKIPLSVDTFYPQVAARALEAGADIIMLDNMSPEMMERAVDMINGEAETECSGNVTRENVEKLTAIGVDYISCGALTHSAPILDISMKNLHAI